MGTKDYAPYIQQLKAQSAKGMWVVVSGRDAINFALQADQFGLLKSVFTVGQNFAMPATIKGMGGVAEGIWGIVNYATNLDTPQSRTFIAAWKEEHGSDPTNIEAENYVGMQVLFAAIAKAGYWHDRTIIDCLDAATAELPDKVALTDWNSIEGHA